MEKLEKLYEGKAKIIYSTKDENKVIQYFKDDISAFDGKKKEVIENKGVLNNIISSRIFEYLEDNSINTHYIEKLNDREMLVKKCKMFPLEFVMRNITAGSICRKYGVDEGVPIEPNILELYYKDDALGDPMMNDSHALWATNIGPGFLGSCKHAAVKINDILKEYFKEKNILLVDHKIEFGWDIEAAKRTSATDELVIIGDEISPDSCRLWDAKTNQKLDKDNFRFDLGNISETYVKIQDALESDNQTTTR